VAAGSAITEDVPAGALALGRARQQVKPGWAEARRRRRETERAQAEAATAAAATGTKAGRGESR
jgi:bifunctional UDP-N-acetylglucosamine pyrophosphorylase/glucosamine-1-phosphate N-acetyltransferase